MNYYTSFSTELQSKIHSSVQHIHGCYTIQLNESKYMNDILFKLILHLVRVHCRDIILDNKIITFTYEPIISSEIPQIEQYQHVHPLYSIFYILNNSSHQLILPHYQFVDYKYKNFVKKHTDIIFLKKHCHIGFSGSEYYIFTELFGNETRSTDHVLKVHIWDKPSNIQDTVSEYIPDKLTEETTIIEDKDSYHVVEHRELFVKRSDFPTYFWDDMFFQKLKDIQMFASLFKNIRDYARYDDPIHENEKVPWDMVLFDSNNSFRILWDEEYILQNKYANYIRNKYGEHIYIYMLLIYQPNENTTITYMGEIYDKLSIHWILNGHTRFVNKKYSGWEYIQEIIEQDIQIKKLEIGEEFGILQYVLMKYEIMDEKLNMLLKPKSQIISNIQVVYMYHVSNTSNERKQMNINHLIKLSENSLFYLIFLSSNTGYICFNNIMFSVGNCILFSKKEMSGILEINSNETIQMLLYSVDFCL
jgi:hypothetical protein